MFCSLSQVAVQVDEQAPVPEKPKERVDDLYTATTFAVLKPRST